MDEDEGIRQDEKTYSDYIIKSIYWTIGHASFGLLPLLFMLFIELISNGKVGSDEVQHLLNDGVHLFVCCAVIGAIIVESILSGYSMKISQVFKLSIIPIFIFSLILIDYILINLKAIDSNSFSINRRTSIIVILFTFLYCIFTKASIYIKQDAKPE